MSIDKLQAVPAQLEEILGGIQIGVLSSWGHAQGRDRVSSRIVSYLRAAGAAVHIFGDGAHGPEGLPPATSIQPWNGSSEEFVDWLRTRQLRAVVFSEYLQWDDSRELPLVDVARAQGAATFGYLVWERFFAERADTYRGYDAVLAPHQAFSKVLHQASIDTIPFRLAWRPPLPKPRLRDGEPVEFLHVAGAREGWGRKATRRVVAAFLELAGETEFSFRVTSQEPLDDGAGERLRAAGVEVYEEYLPPARLVARLRCARVAVHPSRWEGMGLPILESLAEGTPVITTDGPPMNEWIRHKSEGLLVPATEQPQSGIAVPAREVKVADLVKTMLILKNRDLLRHLETKALLGGAGLLGPDQAARQLATGIYRWIQGTS